MCPLTPCGLRKWGQRCVYISHTVNQVLWTPDLGTPPLVHMEMSWDSWSFHRDLRPQDRGPERPGLARRKGCGPKEGAVSGQSPASPDPQPHRHEPPLAAGRVPQLHTSAQIRNFWPDSAFCGKATSPDRALTPCMARQQQIRPEKWPARVSRGETGGDRLLGPTPSQPGLGLPLKTSGSYSPPSPSGD